MKTKTNNLTTKRFVIRKSLIYININSLKNKNIKDLLNSSKLNKYSLK